tara:strand:+ start:1595 stop:3442 length:1848 start_codon:yes stop_codon:yes gene_type:complete
MKIPSPIIHHLLPGLVATCLLLPLSVRGYDSPNFDFSPFYGDGIFLEKSDLESLLESLASLASNFPNQEKVDDDLREKAIAIALRIDQVHYNSRQAHLRLKSGESPNATPYFNSLSAVSEALWTASNRLTTRPVEPEQSKLAPFLMELSLLIHPDPSIERLTTYAAATNGRPLPWEKLTILDPLTNRSTAQSRLLFKEAMTLLSADSTSSEDEPTPGNPTGAQAAPLDSASALEKFEPVSVSLSTLRYLNRETGPPVAGELTLTIRIPETASERDMLSRLDNTIPTIPLFSPSGGTTVTSPSFSAEILAQFNISWPKGTIAEISFSPLEPIPGPAENNQVWSRLPTLALFKAALTISESNPDIILAGDAPNPGAPPVLPGEISENIEAARALEKPYLLIPGSARGQLLSYIKKSERLDLLFEPELISYSIHTKAYRATTSPTEEAWLNASKSFAEIRSVSSRMSLVELSRNSKVQERLEAILESVPNHTSAWVMLEFGRASAPVETTATSASVVSVITSLLEPYFELRQPSPDINTLRQMLPDTETEISRIRPTIPPEIRACLTSAEDALQAIENYLNLSNRGTSTAFQKLELVDEALTKFATERAKAELGESTP